MISNHLRRACVRAVTNGGFTMITTEACKLVGQEFAHEISVRDCDKHQLR